VKQSTPPPMPMRIEETGPTKPAAGVIATSPATALLGRVTASDPESTTLELHGLDPLTGPTTTRLSTAGRHNAANALAVAGAALGSGILWGIGALYTRVRGVEGMGFGDVKMMAMIGAFLGWKLMLLTLVLSSFAGSVIGVGVIALRRGSMSRTAARETRKTLVRSQAMT